MAIIKAVINKKSKDTRIGISVKPILGDLYLTRLNGLCAASELKVGDRLISINSQPFKTSEEAISMLKGAVGDLSIEVEQSPPQILIASIDGASVEGVYANKHDMPQILKDTNVPFETWSKLINAVTLDLAPDVTNAYQFQAALPSFNANYVGSQMVGGVIGFGKESRHELKTLKLNAAVASAHSNAVLMGANVLAKATVLLATHGIVPELIIDVRYPFGKDKVRRAAFQDPFEADPLGEGKVEPFPGSSKRYCLPVGLRFSKV